MQRPFKGGLGLFSWLRAEEDRRPLALLICLLIASFLMGGSSRGAVATLIVLRPLATMIGAIGLMTLHREQVYRFRWVFAAAAAIVLLVLWQIIPLPSAIYSSLPGRELVRQIDGLTESGSWRPMSLAPLETRDSLLSLVVPLSALILAVQLGDRSRIILLKALLLLGLSTIGVGLLQIWGDPKGLLYFYEMAKGYGDSTGFFANKNHQAIFIASLIPMAFAYRSLSVSRKSKSYVRNLNYINIAFCIAMIPVLLVTNSRTGFMAGIVAVVTCLFAFRLDRDALGTKNRWGVLIFMVGGLSFFVAALFAGRALAWSRLIELSPVDDLRYKVLPIVRQAISSFMPWGAGGGTFQTVYIRFEPDSLLSPIIMNQVHNDWLDIPLAYGIPGLVLLLLVTIALAWSGLRVFQKGIGETRSVLGRSGFLGLVLFGIGSLTDYPLRTGALEVVFVIFVVWLVDALAHKSQGSIYP